MTRQTAWTYLIVAGCLEIIWALGLKRTEGFTKVLPTAAVFVCLAASFYFLSQSARVLPIGTSYAVWTGLGAAGTAILGIIFFGEPLSWARALCVILIVAGTLGLKYFSS